MPTSFHRIYPIIGSPIQSLPITSLDGGELVFVRSKDDFPAPVEGVITLVENYTYLVIANVDLGGDRLYSPSKGSITGLSPETCSITSTLSAGQALITAEHTFQLRNISLATSAGAYCIRQDGTGKVNAVADWLAVNFKGGIAGHITNLDNFIAVLCAVQPPCDGFQFYGEFNTIAFELSIMSVLTAGYIAIYVHPDTLIQRRFRYFNGPLVALAGATALSIPSNAVVNSEGLILSFVNFSGGGTYLDGVDFLSEKARFRDCRGIKNTSRVGRLFWSDSALATVITTPGEYVDLNVITTFDGLSQRFTHEDNKLTYISDFETTFLVTGIISLSSGNNNIISLAIRKNGDILANSEQKTTTSGAGRSENIVVQALVTLKKFDFIRFAAANNTAANNIVASDGSLLVEED